MVQQSRQVHWRRMNHSKETHSDSKYFKLCLKKKQQIIILTHYFTFIWALILSLLALKKSLISLIYTTPDKVHNRCHTPRLPPFTMALISGTFPWRRLTGCRFVSGSRWRVAGCATNRKSDPRTYLPCTTAPAWRRWRACGEPIAWRGPWRRRRGAYSARRSRSPSGLRLGGRGCRWPVVREKMFRWDTWK